ncbi:MAG: DMT family transporter [Gammaproteobacteria bacterium]
MPTHPLLLGALLPTLGELSLTLMAATIKHVSPEVGTWTVVFLRNLFGLLVLLPIVARHGGTLFRSNRPGTMAIRALAGLTAMYGFFYVLANLPLAEATLVKLTTPFFMPLIAWFWLKEKIGRRNATAIVVGFIGVLFILRPGAATFDPDALVGIAAAVLASVAMVAIREMNDAEPPDRIVFHFTLVCTLVSAIPLLWGWQAPDVALWPWLVAMGVFGTIGQLLITRAFQVAPPGRIGPFTYTSVVFAALLGALVWDEVLLVTTVIGSVLIFVAGVINLSAGAGKAARPLDQTPE